MRIYIYMSVNACVHVCVYFFVNLLSLPLLNLLYELSSLSNEVYLISNY